MVAATVLLWPRSQPQAPPLPSKPEPVRIAARVVPPSIEARLPEPPAPEPVYQQAPPTPPEAAKSILPAPAIAAAPPVVNAPGPPAPEPVRATYHTVVAGDNLWKISDTVYQYAYFWPLIFQENQTLLKHPDTLLIGMRLAIPVFDGRVGELSEPEFQQLADGYLRVYQVYQHHRHPRAPYYLWVAYRLRAHWIPDNDLMLGAPEDLEFIQQLRGRGLIH
jgi:hypothetical protein